MFIILFSSLYQINFFNYNFTAVAFADTAFLYLFIYFIFNQIINIIFPVLKDIPVRQVSREFGNGYTLTALVNSHGEGSGKGQGTEQKDLTTIDVYAPIDSNLEVEDTIVRVFVNEQVKTSTVIVFTVRDVLADMSNNAPLNLKAKLSIDTEPIDLNKPSYQMIVALAKRRLAANY